MSQERAICKQEGGKGSGERIYVRLASEVGEEGEEEGEEEEDRNVSNPSARNGGENARMVSVKEKLIKERLNS